MWLLKTEPSVYSYADLEREGKTAWDGVTNPVALKNLRAMQAGDRVFVYHTGDEKAAVGIAEVVRAAYPDPKRSDARLVVVDLRPVERLGRSPLVRQGRLSVVPLTAAQWKAIETRGRQ
jgi:predicted RNA-binding protein with PUA-like domain